MFSFLNVFCLLALSFPIDGSFESGQNRRETTDQNSSRELTEEAILPPKTIRSVTAFRDDFNSWNPNNYHVACTAWGGGNNELQVYTPGQSNLFTKNGHLYIKPTLTVNHPDFNEGKLYHGQMDLNGLWGYCTQGSNSGCNKHGGQDILPPVMSGYITTKAAIKYGRMNIRAKLPKADWTWPAIWTLPRNNTYGGWPQSCAMDIMESRGNAVAMGGGVNHGVNEVMSKLDWGPSGDTSQFYKTQVFKRKSSGDWHDDFHVYTLEWTADHLYTYVDNEIILRADTPSNSYWSYGGFSGDNIWKHGGKDAPFDQYFQLVLNVAVGGNWFKNDYQYAYTRPWTDSSRHPKRNFWEHRNQWQNSWQGDNAAMIVDYVEMIQY